MPRPCAAAAVLAAAACRAAAFRPGPPARPGDALPRLDAALDDDGSPSSPVSSPARSLGRNGKKNDGTDSNFMDYQKNNGGELYASQKILLSIIAIVFGSLLLSFLTGGGAL